MADASAMYQESLRAFLKPVLKYLDDASVSEIMINGPTEVWIEAKGKLTRIDTKFTDEGLLGAARNIAQFVGRILNDERPRLDARLPDGSRIHVVLPPIARKGVTISIRKFFKDKLTIEKLIEFGSMTPQMAYLIKAMVHTKLNILVAGGTGSGKTTLLNIVSTLIPNDERILTIEDSAELQLQQDHIVPFESRPADKFGKGEVNMGHLLHSALRLRPDRIVVGEVRGGEAFDLMQAMNTGHGGSMATTHANTPTDTLRRIESLCLQSGVELPMVAVRAQVASAINAVVCCERFHDGSRRTTAVAEVLPLNEKGEYRTQNLFVYAPTHKDEDGKIHGYHAPTGLLPTFLGRMRAHGFSDIDEGFFDPKTYGLPPPPNIFVGEYKAAWAPSLKHRERGEADPADIQKAIDEAAKYAAMAEARHKEKVKSGTVGEGLDFSNSHGSHGDKGHAKEAPKPAESKPIAPPPPAAPAAPPPEPPKAAPAQSASGSREMPFKIFPPPPPPMPVDDDEDEDVEMDSHPTRPPTAGPGPGGRLALPPAPSQRQATPPGGSAQAAPPRPTTPVRRPAVQPQGLADFGEDEVTAAPVSRPSSGLPPGKRPLPFQSRQAPQRRPAAPAAEADEDEEGEPPAEGDKTALHSLPDRFRR